MMEYIRFGEKFIVWVNNILYNASSAILLNNVKGKKRLFVREGGPLSPLLYVSCISLLVRSCMQYVIYVAWQEGDTLIATLGLTIL
jgi:hypothetical protein